MKKVVLSCLKMNLKISHDEFKKSKIHFRYKVTFELVQSHFSYLFKPIMRKKGWRVGLGQEQVV